MILGQLLQTGRRLCECRSSDFVPDTEGEIVVINYSLHDQFSAHSFDLELPKLAETIREWLMNNNAVGYLVIRRSNHRYQQEFPAPLGREPMDRIYLTAATDRQFQFESYYLKTCAATAGFKLLPTCTADLISETSRVNLFRQSQSRAPEQNLSLFPEVPEFAR